MKKLSKAPSESAAGGEAVRGWQQRALSDCSRMCVDTLCFGRLVIGSFGGKVERRRRRGRRRRRRRGANTRPTDTRLSVRDERQSRHNSPLAFQRPGSARHSSPQHTHTHTCVHAHTYTQTNSMAVQAPGRHTSLSGLGVFLCIHTVHAYIHLNKCNLL